MKRLFRSLAAVLAVAALLCSSVPAMAAEAPAVSVQVDGKTLIFTDAVPQFKDGRTFVPFREVFEALGAQVTGDGKTAAASRGGRTVSMTIGSTQATLTQDGETVSIAMDAAPYVDGATGRTYVPVRSAAQALGCAVGWDKEARTAIIVDVDELVDNAVEGKSFTYWEKYLAYAQQFNEGIWDTELAMDGSYTISDKDVAPTPIKVPMTVTAKGISSGETQMEMDMTMKMDMSDLIAASREEGGDSSSAMALAMMNAMFRDGFGVQMRGDLSKGKLYFTMSSKMLEESGMPAGEWYSMDLDTMLQEAGMNVTFAQLLEGAGDVTAKDYEEMLKTSLALSAPSGVEDYAELKKAVEKAAAALSDGGFKKSGDNYTATLDLPGDIPEESYKLSFTLTIQNDKVVAYAMEMSGEVDDGTDKVTMVMSQALDQQNALTGKVKMIVSDLMDMDFTLTGKYARGTTAPVTQPPAGAAVTPIDEMMPDTSGSVGVIGGADGPTAVFVGGAS